MFCFIWFVCMLGNFSLYFNYSIGQIQYGLLNIMFLCFDSELVFRVF